MCGIFGAFSLDDRPIDGHDQLAAVARTLEHRGPDHMGVLSSDRAFLAVNRLRITDPRPRADQPFSSPAGDWIACNGEIYNHRELRSRFSSYAFRSQTDAEILVPLFLSTAPADWLPRLNGRFAIACWSPSQRRLTLARDRAGECPLFYSVQSSTIFVASEIRALLEAGVAGSKLDQAALVEYLTAGYAMSPRTLLEDIRSVEPGHWMTFDDSGIHAGTYWKAPTRRRPGTIGSRRIRATLENSVNLQLPESMPTGVLLSGGIDSSMVASLAQRELSHRKLEPPFTFSARFLDREFDESGFAARVAAEIGSTHHSVPVSDNDLVSALPLAWQTGEPVADPALLPTNIVAAYASQYVRVLMSGEGADELFGGYPTYMGHLWAPAVRAVAELLPPLARWSERNEASRSRMPIGMLLRQLMRGARADWATRHLLWFGVDAGASLAPDGCEPERWFELADNRGEDPMALDFNTYLRDRLLTKLDRATMAESVEARAPFLDHRVIEQGLSEPPSALVDHVSTKKVLKDAARGIVPDFVVRRRKHGLSVPTARLLSGALREWAGDILSGTSSGRIGQIDAAVVSRWWDEHDNGLANHARRLWPLFVLLNWHRELTLENGA